MKILLVEDHAAVAQISYDVLREVHEHDVTLVSSGAAALAAMDLVRPDLVLLDLNLPDMSGYEVAARLRVDQRWQSTIIVALTGFGSELYPQAAASSGIDAHFRKPMPFALLPSIKRARPA
jgi:CheY-like chemotaxis protein